MDPNDKHRFIERNKRRVMKDHIITPRNMKVLMEDQKMLNPFYTQDIPTDRMTQGGQILSDNCPDPINIHYNRKLNIRNLKRASSVN